MSPRRTRRTSAPLDGRGVALVVVMMLVALLVTATLAVVTATTTDVRIAAAFRWGMAAEYAAEAGVHRALADLRPLPDWTPVLNGTIQSGFVDGAPSGMRTSDGGVFVDLDLTQSLATCGRLLPCSDGDRTAITAAHPWGANNPRWRLFAYGPTTALVGGGPSGGSPLYVVVLVADDPADADGNPEQDDVGSNPGAGVIRLRAEAFGPAGVRRTVEATVARSPVGARVRVLHWRRIG